MQFKPQILKFVSVNSFNPQFSMSLTKMKQNFAIISIFLRITCTTLCKISWGLSQQNRRTLVIGGREFTKKQEAKNGKTHWKCSRRGSHKCKTIAMTRDNDFISCRNEHTHKREHTYKKLLKGLSASTENTEPHRILLDSERAALNAFTSHHTGALLKVCFFIYVKRSTGK